MHVAPMPDICPFWYATIFFGLKKYAKKVREFATKIALRQNSVRDTLVGVLGILVVVLDILVGVLGFWLAYFFLFGVYGILCVIFSE